MDSNQQYSVRSAYLYVLNALKNALSVLFSFVVAVLSAAKDAYERRHWVRNALMEQSPAH